MTDPASASTDDEPLFEAAAVWHARMRETAGSRRALDARRRDFERWLAADPRNAAAYDEVERLWPMVEVPPESRAPAVRRRRASPVLPRLALAACILLLAGAGWAGRDVLLDLVRADHATGIGERAAITLADGSRLVLGSDSAAAVDLGPGLRQVRLYRGQAWFEVTPDPGRPFVVATGEGSVRVVGTRFDIRIGDQATTVSVAEGRVELRDADPTGAPVVLERGQQASLSPGGVSAPRPFSEAEVTAWRRGQLVFFETPLAEVVDQLNRHRHGHIAILSPELSRLRVSGVFRTDDPDAVLAAIRDALPVRVQRLTGYLVLLR